jgi:3-hydroxybutyryl-CoA dehydrogenase
MTMTIRAVAVIGAGTMGHGIAQAAAHAGWDVRLSDTDAQALGAGVASIGRNLEGAVSRGKLERPAADSVLDRVHAVPSLRDACRDADLVIEAVVEQLDVKRAALDHAAQVARPGALLASNTSSLSIGAIASALPRPDRMIGLHFFNPVHLMRLVEVVVHAGTTDETRADALAVVAAMGKEAIVVKDSPGFASSRLGVVLGLEAIRMVEQGVASAKDIDRAMELGYNHPMGPLKLTDLVGLDVRLRIAEHLYATLGGSQYRPPELLRSMVAQGRLGKKSGRGFYEWEERGEPPTR